MSDAPKSAFCADVVHSCHGRPTSVMHTYAWKGQLLQPRGKLKATLTSSRKRPSATKALGKRRTLEISHDLLNCVIHE